jgi:hypothetical protein
MLGGVQNPAALTMHHMVSSGATLALTTKAGDYFLPVTLSGSPSVRLPVTRCTVCFPRNYRSLLFKAMQFLPA